LEGPGEFSLVLGEMPQAPHAGGHSHEPAEHGPLVNKGLEPWSPDGAACPASFSCRRLAARFRTQLRQSARPTLPKVACTAATAARATTLSTSARARPGTSVSACVISPVIGTPPGYPPVREAKVELARTAHECKQLAFGFDTLRLPDSGNPRASAQPGDKVGAQLSGSVVCSVGYSPGGGRRDRHPVGCRSSVPLLCCDHVQPVMETRPADGRS
jgi:hypothetical protein